MYSNLEKLSPLHFGGYSFFSNITIGNTEKNEPLTHI